MKALSLMWISLRIASLAGDGMSRRIILERKLTVFVATLFAFMILCFSPLGLERDYNRRGLFHGLLRGTRKVC